MEAFSCIMTEICYNICVQPVHVYSLLRLSLKKTGSVAGLFFLLTTGESEGIMVMLQELDLAHKLQELDRLGA